MHRNKPNITYSSKNGLIAMKQKANISIEIYASNVTIGFDLAMTLTFNFQVQIWDLLYFSQSDLIAMKARKNKCIHWTQGPKCDHQIWLWPWPWFKFQGKGLWPLTWAWL